MGHIDKVPIPIKAEGLADEARSEGRIVAYLRIPATDDVIGVPITGPPTRHARGGWQAFSCRAARCVDRCALRCSRASIQGIRHAIAVFILNRDRTDASKV